MIKMVLFDLDGTLISMDQDVFTKMYFSLMAKKMAHYGYKLEELISVIWKGTAAMIKNNGSCSNEEVFWNVFKQAYPGKFETDYKLFEEFYYNEFQQVESVCGKIEEANSIVQYCKELGFRTALATNPLFPTAATESRIRWAGLNKDDFELVTTYENSSTCKPNPQYYVEVCEKLNIKPEECLMVGNDVDEDMIAQTLGMKVFLITKDLINRSGKDIDEFPHGSFEDLKQFLLNIHK